MCHMVLLFFIAIAAAAPPRSSRHDTGTDNFASSFIGFFFLSVFVVFVPFICSGLCVLGIWCRSHLRKTGAPLFPHSTEARTMAANAARGTVQSAYHATATGAGATPPMHAVTPGMTQEPFPEAPPSAPMVIRVEQIPAQPTNHPAQSPNGEGISDWEIVSAGQSAPQSNLQLGRPVPPPK